MSYEFAGTIYRNYDSAAEGGFREWALACSDVADYAGKDAAALADECVSSGWFSEFEAKYGALKAGAVEGFAASLVREADGCVTCGNS